MATKDFRELCQEWDEQDHEREKKAMPLICDLIGEPTREHLDGRPIWQGDTWRALLGNGEFVLFREPDAAPDDIPSPEALQALGLCLWLGLGVDTHDGRRISAQRDD